jgi:hypothetical protein
MLSTTLNPGVNWLTLSAYLATSYRTYKFDVHHWWHIWSFNTIQLHMQVWATNVDFATHLTETYSEYPLLKGKLSHLTHHKAFYVLYTFSIAFQWFMSVILRYIKISWLQVLSQGESYLNILKLLITEALGTYSIWSISFVHETLSIPNLITLDS